MKKISTQTNAFYFIAAGIIIAVAICVMILMRGCDKQAAAISTTSAAGGESATLPDYSGSSEQETVDDGRSRHPHINPDGSINDDVLKQYGWYWSMTEGGEKFNILETEDEAEVKADSKSVSEQDEKAFSQVSEWVEYRNYLDDGSCEVVVPQGRTLAEFHIEQEEVFVGDAVRFLRDQMLASGKAIRFKLSEKDGKQSVGIEFESGETVTLSYTEERGRYNFATDKKE